MQAAQPPFTSTITASPWPPPEQIAAQPSAAAPAAQLVDERAEDPRAGGADRVTEGDRAAVDVDPVLVDPEHPDRVQRDRGERLVDLPQVDVLGLQAGLARAPSRPPWPASAPGRRSRRRPAAWATIVASADLPLRLAHSSLASTSAPPPSLTPGELPAVWEPSLMKIGGQLGQRLEARVAARCLVDLDHRVALLALDRHRHDLLGQPALVGRLDRELVRAQRPAVHVGPRQLELGGHLAGLLGHVLARERVGETVVDHRVDRLGVAHAEAEAGLLEQVRRVRHRLHTATDADLEVAGADRRVEQPGRADSRGADLVDRLRGDLLRDPGLDLRLARGDLALAGLDHLAHDHVLDLLGRDLGALERGLDRGAAELGRVEARKTAAELADRRAGGGQDHGLGHRFWFSGFGGCCQS